MSKCPFSVVPGKGDLPFFKDTLSFLFKDPIKAIDEKRSKYGDVFKTNVFNNDNVMIIDEKVTRWALIENSKKLDSRKAWETPLKDLFPNGLMLMDGKRHRQHRSVISEVFKKEALEGYLKIMNPIVDSILSDIESEQLTMFPFFKELTLKVALEVFFGLNPKTDISKINTAITNIVKASASLHINLPFTTYGKGIRARKFLIKYFNNLIGDRRKNPGSDLFSMLVTAEGEEGQKFTDTEVIDHLIFILMAAHDTTASTLTSLAYFLAKNKEWQSELRNESLALSDDVLDVKSLKGLERTNLAVKETLRMYPPLTSVARVSNDNVSFEDWHFPKDTTFGLPISYLQRMDKVWTNANKWDPERFNDNRKEDRKCPYAYAPFGAGLHHCIGSNFAEMQINLVIGKMLQRFELILPEDYEVPMNAIPLHEPKDGLPMELRPIN